MTVTVKCINAIHLYLHLVMNMKHEANNKVKDTTSRDKPAVLLSDFICPSLLLGLSLE